MRPVYVRYVLRARPVLVLIAATVLVAGGCSTGSPRRGAHPPAAVSHAPSTDPRIAAAARAAQEAMNRQLSGDYGGAWDTYTAAGKAAISRADFVRLQTACPPKGLNQSARVVGARSQDANTVVARIEVAGATTARTMRYEGGTWLIEPSDTAMADFKLGVDQAIAKQKAAGTC